jgi:hypothetical protein
MDASAGETKVFAINDERRGHNLIAGEERGGRCAFGSEGESEVGAAAGFYAGGLGGKEETFGGHALGPR